MSRPTRIAHIGRATPVSQPSSAQANAAKLVERLDVLCTVAETASFLRNSPRTVRRLIATGRLQSFRIVQAQQARVLIPRSAIEALIVQSLGG